MWSKLKPRFASLQVKVFTLTIVLIVLPITGLGVFFYSQDAQAVSEKVTLSNMNTLTQIGTNLEDIFDDIKQNSLLLYQSPEVRGFLQDEGSSEALEADYMRLDASILNMLAYERYASAVDIRRLDGKQYRSSSDYDGIDDERTQEILQQTGKLTFAGSADSRYPGGKAAYVFTRKINDINNLGVTLGVMQIYIDKNRILDLFANIPLASQSNYFIVQNGQIIISLDERYVGKPVQDVLGGFEFRGQKGFSTLSVEGTKQMLTYYDLKYPDLYLVNLISLEQISREKSLVIQVLTFTIALTIVICSVIAYWVSAYILSPLKTVTRSMRNLEKENFNIAVPVKGNDEITVLARNFNKMSERLGELVNQVYVSELREKDAQIKALQAYINPHFLYNTLDTICWMSRMENAYETCRLVEALSKLFRMSVQSDQKETTVARELEYTRNYLMIQECRYSDSIDFVIRVEPGLEACRTTGFVLQPLIENAILHGLEAQEGGGTVTVTVCSRGDRLIYMVENDGEDADLQELEYLLDHYTEGKKGMAITGVNSRIRLNYGEAYGLHFYPGNPRGLKAVVEQPLGTGRDEV